MKERPILFSGEMVRALVAGRKTQTRRVVKYSRRPVQGADGVWYDADGIHPGVPLRFPYGAPGDRLWVRETFSVTDDALYLRADGEEFEGPDGDHVEPKWKPSIHMPRWASRLTLEVVAVRVERLQDISEADALAEGVTLRGSTRFENEARLAFKQLWESINGAESWAQNPWLWVIEFKKLEAGV